MSDTPVLSQGVGYGIVCGMGLFFSACMMGITFMQRRYTSTASESAEEFSSASRSVKPGLIATGIVSAWTWAATLLQSSAVAYKFGISGTYWYASGATVQVLLFAQLAAKLKLNAPYAHTFLEIIGCRWKGSFVHSIFLFFALACNIIVSTMLVLGGSATVSDLTGMSTQAACFLIPLGVALYVWIGGMRSTLIADYTHTAILYIILLLFVFVTYGTSDKIGSPAKMYEMLANVSAKTPVARNAGGSYVTMRSTGGIIFGVLNIVGNFGTVFNDQAYWQRAIASTPQTAVKAYLLGGLAWFAIPFTLSTTLGLAAVALEVPLTAAQVSAGLPAPTAAAALLGKGGAVAMLILLFLAVTSATAGELVAVSSVLTYDIYKRHINKNANEAQILRFSQAMVAFAAIMMGVLGVAFYYIGISMGYLYELMGTIIGSSVVPVALATSWKKANRTGCTVGSIAGLALGLVAWLVTAAKLNGGVVTIDTTGQDYPMLAGNCVALGVGAVVSLVWSLVDPEDFDFDITRALNYDIVLHSTVAAMDSKNEEIVSEPLVEENAEKESFGENDEKVVESISTVKNAKDLRVELPEIDFHGLNKAFKFAVYASVTLFLVFIILVPIPLFASGYVYPVKGFTAWVAVSVTWSFVAAFIVVLYPLYESRQELARIFRGIYKDIFHNGTGALARAS
ncbi:urea transporter [Phaffia rhodozyma]|uniref:Urea transporter n=1 Tax=Phaffia rhodozyma TaxID=264483 RepID=A0A0F7SKZ3_PHARH|nr:urea transporter [Phaffia rhodozyma]